MSRKVDNEDVEKKPAESYRPQKNRLDRSHQIFTSERYERLSRRTIDVPAQIDYIEIHFYIVFGDNAQFKTKSKFEGEFGLSPVRYSDFNKTILFAISDEEKFQRFVDLLYQFINSPDDVLPRAKAYAIVTTIHDFEFLNRERILGYSRTHVILDLVNIHQHISNRYDRIKASLFPYIRDLRDSGRIGSFQSDGETTIEIHDIGHDDLFSITDNFDILCAAHSLRVPRIRPDSYNIENLTWGITIQRNPNGHLVGVLDNGVRPIAPLSNIVVDSGIDITSSISPDATQTTHPHGTIVASLAAVGTRLFEVGHDEFIADANILPIKILQDFDGTFGMYDLIAAIKQAVNDYDVRIFNLSVCAQGKMYNEPPSVLAYHLDRLAYDLDILIFIAAGNLEDNSLQAMQSAEWRDHPFHRYPNHFYDRETSTDCHVCEATNICAPAESLNNMTVGATADNLREDGSTHLTLSKELPAFYTRKNHYDYGQLVNGTAIKQSQTNRNISKPDIVMPGGDRLNPESGMQVFGFGENGNDFYAFDSGTSLAAPLAANLAAKVLNQYPKLSMQAIKALIINSAERGSNDSFLEEVELKMKNRLSYTKYGSDFVSLSRGQKTQISKGFNRQNLYRNLVGYGQPDESRLLYSTDKSVTLVLEDTIANRTHKVVPIRIPLYLLQRTQSKRLFIKATLCFKMFPSWGNHLDYNPLHISFNYVRQVDADINRTARIIGNRDDNFFNSFYQTAAILAATDPEKINELKAVERKKALAIKNKLEKWSEDYFPPINKPFSNTQQLEIHIQKEEIEKVSGHIVLAIRCALKENLSPAMRAWADAQEEHPFSLVLSIQDETKWFDDYSLYEQLMAINELEAIADIEAEAEAAEAEAES